MQYATPQSFTENVCEQKEAKIGMFRIMYLNGKTRTRPRFQFVGLGFLVKKI